MPQLGLAFSPTNQTMPGSGMARSAAPSTVQDAIKILSFRLPTTVGQNGIAPQSLLGSPTGFGQQLGSALAENWLRSLFSGAGMPTSQTAPGLGQPALGASPVPGAMPQGPGSLPNTTPTIAFENGQPTSNQPTGGINTGNPGGGGSVYPGTPPTVNPGINTTNPGGIGGGFRMGL